MRKANRGSFKPGVSGNPRGRAVRTDSIVNPYSGHGTTRDRRTYTAFNVPFVTDREALTMWRGDWLARTIIEALPDDAFRRGYDIALDDKEQAEELKSTAEELCLDEHCKHAAQIERAFGGAAILPVLDGAQDDYAKPLDLNRITKVLAFHVLEPRELLPRRWYTDLRSPKFGTPETYAVQPIAGRGYQAGLPEIHESRLVIFPGKRVSKQLQPGQLDGWGDSVLMPVREVIADFGLGWASAASILADFAKGVIKKAGLMDLLASDKGKDTLAAWRDSIDMTTSSLRAVLIDGEDEYTRQSTPISGLDSVLLQLGQVAAGAAEMPMTRLLGMSPGGMNATGESDTRAWYDTVGRAQATKYRRPVEHLLKLIMRSTEGPTGGEEPEVWSIQWKPLWTPSEKEQAETRNIQAQVDAVYLDREVLTPEEIRESRFGGDTWSAETTTDDAAWTAQAEVPLTTPTVEGAEPGAADPASPATPAAPAPTDLQLNGAQVTSLVEVIKSAVIGEIPRESAKAIAMLAFHVSPEQAEGLLGPATFKPAVAEAPASAPAAPPPAPEPARADEDERIALLRKLSPSGKCAHCDAKVGHAALEVDHVNGRNWDPAGMSVEQRNEKYAAEYERGVKMQALCRTCNASDGAKNKQEH